MQISFFSVFCFLQDFSEGDGVGVLRRIGMSVVISLVVEFVGGLRLNLVNTCFKLRGTVFLVLSIGLHCYFFNHGTCVHHISKFVLYLNSRFQFQKVIVCFF